MKAQLRGFARERGEHIVSSRVIYPETNLKKLNRGWINTEEFPQLVGSIEEIIRLNVAGDFVEIGCKTAGSTRTICQTLMMHNQIVEVVSIDPDPKAKSYHAALPDFGCAKRRFIRGRSDESRVLERLPEKLSWVLIDGCHCYDCAASDIRNYCSRLSKNGLVLLHDCDWRVEQRPPSQPCGKKRKKVGVYSAMMDSEELRKNFYLLNFVEGATDTKKLYWNGLAIWRKWNAQET